MVGGVGSAVERFEDKLFFVTFVKIVHLVTCMKMDVLSIFLKNKTEGGCS